MVLGIGLKLASKFAKTALGIKALTKVSSVLKALPFTVGKAKKADIFLKAKVGKFFTKAPPKFATKPAIVGKPKLFKLPKKILKGTAGAAIAGGAFFAGEQIARKLFKPAVVKAPVTGAGVIPKGGVPPIVAGAGAGAILPTAAKLALTKGKVGTTLGLLGVGAGLARKAAIPALAGAGVVAIGGQVVDSVTGQVVGVRRVRRSRIGFKRSDLKAFNRVISTAKRVKKILTKAGMGRTFRSTARVTHSQLSREHK